MHNDSAIVARVRQGDVNAFETLISRYKAHVLKIVLRHVPYDEAEDLAQDVFIRAYTSLTTYKEKSGFKPWITTVAVRTCYDFWRKRYRNREVPLSELTENHQQWLEKASGWHSERAYEKEQEAKQAREVLDWALERLSPEDRMVLELTYLQGHSGQEAAALLGWSLANVKVRAHRSRKKLKRILGDAMEK